MSLGFDVYVLHGRERTRSPSCVYSGCSVHYAAHNSARSCRQYCCDPLSPLLYLQVSVWYS